MTEDELRDLERVSNEEIQAFNEHNLKGVFDSDFQFHEIIWGASRNEILKSFLINLHARCLRFCMAIIPTADWENHFSVELVTIFEAIKGRNGEKTAGLLAEHNQMWLELIKAGSFNISRANK